jgi:hypothetical protein
MEKVSFPSVDLSNVKAIPEVMGEIVNGKLVNKLNRLDRKPDILEQGEEVQSLRLDSRENFGYH